jgi:hypothetical protein
MSDSFQSYVFAKALADDGRADFRRVSAWLLAEEIIGVETGDNILGEGTGHVPGERGSSILVADDANWRSLDVNGVAIRTGRIVEAAADWVFGMCPNCNARIEIESEESEPIYEALDAFHDRRGDAVVCPKCGQRTALSDWDFGHGMAAGDAIVKFWNWPRHVEGFGAKLTEVSGLRCRQVWGRI